MVAGDQPSRNFGGPHDVKVGKGTTRVNRSPFPQQLSGLEEYVRLRLSEPYTCTMLKENPRRTVVEVDPAPRGNELVCRSKDRSRAAAGRLFCDQLGLRLSE